MITHTLPKTRVRKTDQLQMFDPGLLKPEMETEKHDLKLEDKSCWKKRGKKSKETTSRRSNTEQG